MENWGLITFRATQLLFDPSQTVKLRMSVIQTIAHELAHQVSNASEAVLLFSFILHYKIQKLSFFGFSMILIYIYRYY